MLAQTLELNVNFLFRFYHLSQIRWDGTGWCHTDVTPSGVSSAAFPFNVFGGGVAPITRFPRWRILHTVPAVMLREDEAWLFLGLTSFLFSLALFVPSPPFLLFVLCVTLDGKLALSNTTLPKRRNNS